MALNISCQSLGAPGAGSVSGRSLEEIVENIQRRLIDERGYRREQVWTPDMHDLIWSAVKQSSRPAQYRSTSLAV